MSNMRVDIIITIIECRGSSGMRGASISRDRTFILAMRLRSSSLSSALDIERKGEVG